MLSKLSWPAYVEVPGLRPTEGRNLSIHKQGSLSINSLSLSPSHHPDMTEILLKGCNIEGLSSIHPRLGANLAQSLWK